MEAEQIKQPGSFYVLGVFIKYDNSHYQRHYSNNYVALRNKLVSIKLRYLIVAFFSHWNSMPRWIHKALDCSETVQ